MVLVGQSEIGDNSPVPQTNLGGNMRDVLTIAMLGLLGAGLVGCDTNASAGTDICFDNAEATCKRTYYCTSDGKVDEGSSDRLSGLGGSYTSVDECTTELQKQNCGNITRVNRCSLKAIYNESKDRACLKSLQTMSCSDWSAGGFSPPSWCDPSNSQTMSCADYVAGKYPTDCSEYCVEPPTSAGDDNP
jgi:hypothetical protein